MSEPTDQMSFLDAIGLDAPEAAETTRKKPSKPGNSASGKPAPKRRGRAPDPAPDTGKPAAKGDAVAAPVAGTKAASGAALDTPNEASSSDTGEQVPLDRFLCFALYSANHAMHGVYKGLLKEIGLTYPQFLAMTVLWESNNVPVGTITAKLQLDTNTLTPLLKRLEAMGLVTRTRNWKDERQVILKLTRKGRALKKKTENFGSCVLSSTGLPIEEVMDLQSRIMKLRDNLRTAGSD